MPTIFEKIILKYVYNLFRDNFILHVSLFQLRFQEGKSTGTQWLDIYHRFFYQAVDENKEIRVAFLINGQTSEWGEIRGGVPKGSVLRPLILLPFINKISHVVSLCSIGLFADDTCLFTEMDNHEETAELINQDLNSIQHWANNWLVALSAPKTKSLTINNKQDSNLNPLV